MSLILFFNVDFKKIIALFLIFFVGLIRAKQSLNLPSILDEIYSNNAVVEGQIISSIDIKTANNKINFFLKVDDAKINNKEYKNLNIKFLISINNIEEYKNQISIGDHIRLAGKLRHPKPATNPYQFDYQKYLLNKDVKNIL